jgi:hypothetical protein
MNDDWKVKKVERLGSDYQLTVGPNRDMDPEAVGAITVGVILSAITLYFLSLIGIGFNWWLFFGILFAWLLVHVYQPAVTTSLTAVCVVIFLIKVFAFS